jgi:pimeloyl-ACP methyl ester carboxylesterase
MPDLTLQFETISAAERPAHVLYVLHGIFGMGRNWAGVARRLVRERPDWGVRLIDLRGHGASQGFVPPHTIESAARDVAELARHLDEAPAGVLGHSFGGKVALMYARQHGERLRQLWLIDSTPDAGPPAGSAWDMLQLLRSLPAMFEARQDLVAHLSEHGVPLATAQWMATNLERSSEGYGWRFELTSLEQLLESFFATDLWAVIEQPPPQAELHIVKARLSSVLRSDAIERIQAISRTNPRVHYHEVPGGHWVNAENPDALLELMISEL